MINVLFTEHGYHNVGINMFCKVQKDQFIFQNPEPDKCTGWRWMNYSEFVQQEPKFIPMKYFIEQGYDDLDKVKR